jgi:hypothetical protein
MPPLNNAGVSRSRRKPLSCHPLIAGVNEMDARAFEPVFVGTAGAAVRGERASDADRLLPVAKAGIGDGDEEHVARPAADGSAQEQQSPRHGRVPGGCPRPPIGRTLGRSGRMDTSAPAR